MCAHANTHMHIHGTHGGQKTTWESWFCPSRPAVSLYWTMSLAPFFLFYPCSFCNKTAITFSKGTEKTKEKKSCLFFTSYSLVTWTSVLFYYYIPSLKIFHVAKCVGGGKAPKKCLKCQKISLIPSSLIKTVQNSMYFQLHGFQCRLLTTEGTACTHAHMYTCTHAQKHT